MITFTEHLAAHLQTTLADHGFTTPVYCNAAPYTPGEITAAHLVLDSAEELINGNSTYSLNYTLTSTLRLHELENPPSFSIWATCVCTALQTLTANFRKYHPLPGHPSSDPIILQWQQERPQAQADESGYHATIAFTLVVQF